MKRAYYDENGFTWSDVAWPSREDVYNRKEALAYWESLVIGDVISYLSNEMLSSSGHIRIGVNVLSTEPDQEKIMLFEGKTSLAKAQKELSDLYDVVYELEAILNYYVRNREKAAENFSSENSQEILSIDKLELPTRSSKIYLSFLPDWYQQPPEKFLAIVIPLFETKLSQLGSLIKKLHSETHMNDILLEGGKFALSVVTNEMLRGFNIVSEEFFLLKSCANIDQN